MGKVAQVAGTDEETQWVGDGVRKGVVGLASGVFSGLDETRHMAYQGLRKDGTQGLVLGLGTQIRAHNMRRFSVPWPDKPATRRKYRSV